jgi:hypothetical protein
MTPEDIAYLRAQSDAAGYNADDLLKAIKYESGGREGVWGGKGGNYFGLIQFGPNERKQFGVDTENPSAHNQIDATLSFLKSRGFKPGMGLLDLYSTINAGSPGHYNASDGNGTVQSHVAKMMGMSPATPTQAQPAQMALASPVESQTPAQPKTDYLSSITNMQGSQRRQGGLLSPQQMAQTEDDGFAQQANEFHAMNRDQFLKGLLQG